ncbi:MFS transporter [Streptomyces sp. NBC_00237]|uniref:MFS transporter n=1 Tax=Streptomyces sp. NBC_00237 TaxID=2975687 RepID=UPI00225AC61A|nr:MFS transporter [Streptomyces sp. NBC_00237]MCX5203258.1 MFS transporter [Streptomyces sp. NBC_00237]
MIRRTGPAGTARPSAEGARDTGAGADVPDTAAGASTPDTAAGHAASERPRARHVPGTLLAAQAVGALGLAAGGTAGALMAEEVLGSAAFTALPLGLLVLGSALSAPPLTAMMRRYGRAAGLTAGYALATAGAVLVIVAAADTGPAALLLGSLLLGTGNNAVMLGRYVAADGAPPGRTARAMSTAMTAVTVGAVVGPALLGPSGTVARALGLPDTAGLYLLAAAAFPTAAALTLRLHHRLRHAGTRLAAQGGSPRGDRVADKAGGRTATAAGGRRRGGAALALLLLGVANLTMVTAMGVTPVHLHAHDWPLGSVGLLVAAHVALMFGPSALSGRLCDRIGARNVALLGTVVQLSALPLVASAGTGSTWTTVPGLLLLGLGWNLQLISGSALVVQRSRGARRHRAEGIGESAMGVGAVAGTLGLAGPLLTAGGLPLLCLALGALTLVASLPLLAEVRR